MSAIEFGPKFIRRAIQTKLAGDLSTENSSYPQHFPIYPPAFTQERAFRAANAPLYFPLGAPIAVWTIASSSSIRTGFIMHWCPSRRSRGISGR